jgi:methyl-accepting chemotaxis protein
MEQLGATVRQNVEHMHHASHIAISASGIAMTDDVVVNSKTMASNSESSKKIVEVIGVIDDIAFQTNILVPHVAVGAQRRRCILGDRERPMQFIVSESLSGSESGTRQGE